MKTRRQSEIHRILFSTAKQAQVGVERWFTASKLGITPLQFGVMRSIDQKGSTLGELARRMMFKPPSILPTVDLLEHLGHIIRREDPHDRRKIRIEVTAKGRKLLERVWMVRHPDPLSIAFRKMSAPKKKQLILLLNELGNAIPKK